jgi:hypothetical protein
MSQSEDSRGSDGSLLCPPYREVGSSGKPIKAVSEGLEVVDVGREVPRPTFRKDSLRCPQHPVGLESFLQILAQVAAVVNDGAKLLHLQEPGSVAVGSKDTLGAVWRPPSGSWPGAGSQ